MVVFMDAVGGGGGAISSVGTQPPLVFVLLCFLEYVLVALATAANPKSER